jgi:hypothetical protein
MGKQTGEMLLPGFGDRKRRTLDQTPAKTGSKAPPMASIT